MERFAAWVRFEVPGVGFEPPEHPFNLALAAVSVAAVAAGVLAAAWLYLWRTEPLGLLERSALARWVHRLLVNKYYLDRLLVDGVAGSIKRPVTAAAAWFDRRVVDGAVDGVGGATRRVAVFSDRVIDHGLIDGAVNGTGVVLNRVGQVLRRVQNGKVQWYAVVMFAGATVFAIALVLAT